MKMDRTLSPSRLQPWQAIAGLGLLFLAALGPWITKYMLVASLNYFVLLGGFSLRKSHFRLHALLMSLAILSDLGLVLTLQILRNATQTAFAFKLPPLGQAHIFCSLIATLLYFAMVYLGIRLLRTAPGPSPRKALHRKLGLATLLFRTLGFLLMFSLLKGHQP